MQIDFYKYQGTGNDFIIVDNRSLNWAPTREDVVQVCDRKFGVGADGLILVQDHDELDFEMVYFNSDGSKSLCGNGSRCAIHFAHHLGLIEKTTHFLTTDGIHQGAITEGAVSFQLFNVTAVSNYDDDYFIDTGSPHYIEFNHTVEDIDVKNRGEALRNDERFSPDGTNVNFVELNDWGIRVRTFERGVEDETLSCGTGVTASALAASFKGLQSPILVKTLGGELEVSFLKKENSFEQITLKGPATPVFQGTINL